MTELSASAKEYIPEYIKRENDLFDKLEKDFVERNKWLFNE